MRIAPLGVIFADKPGDLAAAVMESSLVTHADLRTGAMAYAIAFAVSSSWRVKTLRMFAVS